MKKSALSFLIACKLLGICFFSYGLYLAYADYIHKPVVHTHGIVVSINKVSDESQIAYRPTVEFKAQNKIIHFEDLKNLPDPNYYKPGEAVKVVFKSEDPYKAQINHQWDNLLLIILYLMIGAVFLTIGATGVLVLISGKLR